jgi:hypothetical protein
MIHGFHKGVKKERGEKVCCELRLSSGKLLIGRRSPLPIDIFCRRYFCLILISERYDAGVTVSPCHRCDEKGLGYKGKVQSGLSCLNQEIRNSRMEHL